MALESDHFGKTAHDYLHPTERRLFFPHQLKSAKDFPLSEMDGYEELECPVKDQLSISPRNGFVGNFLEDGGQMGRVDCPHSGKGWATCDYQWSPLSQKEAIKRGHKVACCVDATKSQVHGATEETVNVWPEVRKPGEILVQGESFVSY